MGRSVADSFFNELHVSFLKQRGFKKERRTFVRRRDGFVERFRFDGSQWNSEDRPWNFYFDVGITFEELPRRVPDRDFPKTHAHARLNWIVAGSPKVFEITEKNYVEMLKTITEFVDKASNELPSIAKNIFERCRAGEFIMPPDLTRRSTPTASAAG